jgi:RHS repeat-associated protein
MLALGTIGVSLGMLSPAHAAVTAQSRQGPVPHVAQAQAADFGPGALKSSDVAITGWGDSAGYHLDLGREASGFAWREIVVLSPAGYDASSWTGYQCLSGDGRYAAVAILPTSAVNVQAARDHGGFAYSVDLATGQVHPVAAGVALQYDSPGCGIGDTAVFSVSMGADEQTTQLLVASLPTGRVASALTVAGQVTSAVPGRGELLGVLGSDLVRIPVQPGTRSARPTVVATVGGQPYDVRPSSDGGASFLDVRAGAATATAEHEAAGRVTPVGQGDLTRMQLFQGPSGRAILSGARELAGAAVLAGAGIRAVPDGGLKYGASVSSLEGDALFGPAANYKSSVPEAFATGTGRVLTDPQAPAQVPATTTLPGYREPASVLDSTPAPVIGNPEPHGDAAPSRAGTAKTTAVLTAAQTPACSVPRLSPSLQVMQPSNAQVDWAAQMAEQGLLTGSAYTRPAGFDNLGLAAYAPNSDFPLIPLQHPSTDTWDTVPRSVFEAIMAQESNWDQASWHAIPGVSSDPLVADYYGAAGTVSTIDYAKADCGYGISQVTTGMRAGDTTYSAHGQIKIAVDYQENIAAGLQILESTWNQLYTDNILVNGGDPRYLENWYYAAWAYNSGIEPTGSYNTTGCTPGTSCTGPDGTWGLGWANNPENPAYKPNRPPFLQDSYADAAHPGDWPYEEKIMGWMASPLQRFNGSAYAGPSYNDFETWLQIAPFNTFCNLTANHCDPNSTNTSNPGAGHCMLNDYECWIHQSETWTQYCSPQNTCVSGCPLVCAESSYAYTTGSTEPADPDPYAVDCNVNTASVPSSAIIVDSQASPPLNLQGCSNENWTSNGAFTYIFGTDSAGDPIGAIDTHQVGAGLGGHTFFTHTESGANLSEINTGTWTPNLPSLQYYKIKLHLPRIGGDATDVVYSIYPGGNASPWKIRVNQAWNQETWVTIGTFAMENGGYVMLNNQSAVVDTSGSGYYNYDVAFDAIAFIPEGGTPGAPIGGPPAVTDEPAGSNPAWVDAACGQRTAGDPVDTATGYFSQSYTDLSTPGRGQPLNFSRTYAEATADPNGPNKSSAVNGPFGWGWTFSYNLHAVTGSATGNVTITQEDGSQVTFNDSSGTYTPSAPRYDATLAVSGSDYVYTRRGHDIFTFDKATGHLVAETDLAGEKASTPYQTTLAYNSSGQLSTVTDPAGRTYTLTWSGGHITELLDSAGREVTYGYDTSGDLTDVYGVGTTRSPSLQNNDHTVFSYNTTTHLLTSIRTPDNYGGAASAVTTMTYDSSERVLTQTDADGNTTTFTYGPNGGLATGQTEVTDPSGHATLDTYANGLLSSETKGYGTGNAGTWSYTYDPETLGCSTETDPDGNLQTFSYDDHGNMIAKSDGLGRTTDYLYDANDDLVETIDPAGVATVNQYDQSGHIPSGASGVLDLTSITTTQATNVADTPTLNFGTAPTRTVNYYYDDDAHPGKRTRTVDADGNTTTMTYDAYGDLTSTSDAAGDKTAYGYNTGTGWQTSIVDPDGTAVGVTPGCTPPAVGCTALSHDAWGNVTSTTSPTGGVSKSVYDADGNKVSTTDANNDTTMYSYDAADRLVKTTKPDKTTEQTSYNPDGTVLDTIDGLGHKTAFGYDGQGRQNSRTDSNGRTTSEKIDPTGLVTSVTDPSGRVTTDGHDAAGELTSVSYSDGGTPSVTDAYDPDGRKLTMTDGTGTTTWTYDVFGDVTSQQQGSGATVSYSYDSQGNETSITYPGQTTAVAQAFDAANRVKTITDPGGNTTSFTYYPAGQVHVTTYPDGVTVTSGYDNQGQLTSIAAAAGSTALLTQSYTRDNAGQVSAQTISSTKDTYGYTADEQLKSDSSGSAVTAYGEDAAGNPTTVGSASQAYDAAGQPCWTLPSGTVSSPSCATVPSGATTYAYNTEGQRTAATPSSGTASADGYNQAGDLTSYSGPGGSATYAYNGDGYLTTKTSGGTTTTYAWDNEQNPNVVSDGTSLYLYGPGGLPIEQIGSSATYWFVHDQDGSTLALLSSGGAISGSYSYTPFGLAKHSGTATTPLQYTGQYADATSSLIYLRARYYDPATAEFMSVDPLVGSTGESYQYTSNNPVNATDPSGLCGFWDVVCYVSSFNPFDRLPDYISINLTGTLIPPFNFFGPSVGVNVTLTRYGGIFLGPQAGISVSGTLLDARAGWIDQTNAPTPCQLNSFVGQWSVGISAYLAVFYGVAGPSVAETWGNVGQWGSSNFATEGGLGVGTGFGAGIGGSYDFMISPNGGPSW